MELNIIHVDMDAFYASIEQRDNPKLKGKPVIIGGKSKRGVVSTASYEARRYGVHSAMPIIKARQLCPHGTYLQGDHLKYKEVSNQIREIFYRYTDLVEPLALDEAFLDVKGNYKNSIRIAKEIKREIKEELNLTASIGVSYNKYLAKLASDFDKPSGFKIISPFDAQDIIFPLDVNNLWGVGPKTEKRLKELGFYKISDIAKGDRSLLIREFGKKGYQLYKLAQGEDNRKVTPPGLPKSLGKETTFKYDTKDKGVLRGYLKSLSEEVANRVRNKEVKGKTITLKVKYENFEELSRSRTIEGYISTQEDIYRLAEILLEEIDLDKKLRLIGVTLSNIIEDRVEQLKLL
ncbi:DNA polymerase IV [Orenia metallireducens]|jgi:DNA polymerase-4|uniref:DNA polymerase IV n=1 Tax=Orenia metallireducens TaxID=1413210 RepID=A0A1C0A5X8_9FIRM|nr:DNA polymerase IV [Orenia metallireducens]OCL25544.1 DNA polymerase IV [Orenia metallireducens]